MIVLDGVSTATDGARGQRVDPLIESGPIRPAVPVAVACPSCGTPMHSIGAEHALYCEHCACVVVMGMLG